MPLNDFKGHTLGGLLEIMAAREHERWAGWYRHQRDHAVPGRIAAWNKQAATPYSKLSEEDKEKDREEIRLLFPELLKRVQELEWLVNVLASYEPLEDDDSEIGWAICRAREVLTLDKTP